MIDRSLREVQKMGNGWHAGGDPKSIRGLAAVEIAEVVESFYALEDATGKAHAVATIDAWRDLRSCIARLDEACEALWERSRLSMATLDEEADRRGE